MGRYCYTYALISDCSSRLIYGTVRAYSSFGAINHITGCGLNLAYLLELKVWFGPNHPILLYLNPCLQKRLSTIDNYQND
jgi:hypothetical protein